MDQDIWMVHIWENLLVQIFLPSKDTRHDITQLVAKSISSKKLDNDDAEKVDDLIHVSSLMVRLLI
jgi:Mg2+/Co2+ transporter CorC